MWISKLFNIFIAVHLYQWKKAKNLVRNTKTAYRHYFLWWTLSKFRAFSRKNGWPSLIPGFPQAPLLKIFKTDPIDNVKLVRSWSEAQKMSFFRHPKWQTQNCQKQDRHWKKFTTAPGIALKSSKWPPNTPKGSYTPIAIHIGSLWGILGIQKGSKDLILYPKDPF